jgi:hypothetical protein
MKQVSTQLSMRKWRQSDDTIVCASTPGTLEDYSRLPVMDHNYLVLSRGTLRSTVLSEDNHKKNV